MFKRILVPLDGSKRAERALTVAVRMARAAGGTVILTRVVNAALEFWPSLVPEPTLMQSVIDSELDEAQKYLATISESLAREGISKEHIVLFGPTAPTILSVARSYHADLIVLCSHGYTGMTRWMLGSVAEKLVRYALIPVLVLREGGPVPAGPHPDATHPLRALVTLDGSTLAKAAIEPAASAIAALAAPAQGALHLLRAVGAPLFPTDESQEDIEASLVVAHTHKAKRYLSTTVEHLREGLVAPAVKDLKLPITWSVAVDEDVAHAIVRVAESGEEVEGTGTSGRCDLIAMATHGRGGIQRWALGSITERVLNATKLPLLIVRPADMMDKSNVTWDKATLAEIQG